jgi:hypothetical protein
VSTDREIADYLDIALILFIVVAAIPLLVLLETRSGALLEQISSWRPTCFLVPCEAQAKLRPSLNFLNLSFNFHGIRRELTSMIGLSRTTARRSDIWVTPHDGFISRRGARQSNAGAIAVCTVHGSINIAYFAMPNQTKRITFSLCDSQRRSVALFSYPADTSCKAKTPNHRSRSFRAIYKIATKALCRARSRRREAAAIETI